MSESEQPVSSLDHDEASDTSRGRFWTHPVVLAVALAVTTFVIYARVLGYDFVDYDDGQYVVGNSHVQSGLNWEGVKWAFRTGDASNWHPLTWLSHMLDVSLFGKDAGGHHFTSLALHCLNAALLFGLLRGLTGRQWPSLIVAGLFALHPLHVESVAWVSERKDVLSTCFGLLCLWAYAIYAEKSKVQSPKSKVFYCASLALFALGLMSKPMLVTLPFVMLLLDYWPLNRVASGRWQVAGDRWQGAGGKWQVAGEGTCASNPAAGTALVTLLVEKIPFLVLSAASCVVTFLIQKKGGAVSVALPFTARVANALVSYVRYLRKTFWPDDLSVLYPHPGHWPAWDVGGATILLALGTAGAFLYRKRLPFVTVGWLWFVGMLVPVIGLVQVGIQSMADRYTYLPLVGVFIALVWTADALAARWPAMKPTLAGSAVPALAICALLTWSQVGIWANSETLFRRAIAVTKDNYLAYNNLGFYLSAKGRKTEARDNFRASLKIKPDYADARNNLGHALAGEGKYTEAIEQYQLALRSSPENVEIHNNLGNALSEVGQLEAAIAEYEFVLKRQPDHADAHNNLGIALAMKGRLDEAMTQFREALRLKPDNASAYGNLGNAYAAQHKFAEAARNYREALRLAPSDAQSRNNLGNVLAEQGRLAEAVTNYRAALNLNPVNPEAHFNLGCTLARLGQLDDAKQHLREALRLKPDYPEARKQLERLGKMTKR